ncbi:MAG: efflux RND transporter periplasmic adaptor subunit, partial [Dokdonella sp.]
ELARLELSYTTITAPIDGVISRRNAKVGNFMQVNQALFQIDNFDPLLAVLSVPERELGTLQVGQAVGMHVDSIPGERFEGSIQRISPVVDPSTGTFRVTCEFRDRSARLKSGMFGRLDIAYAQHDNALVVPRGGLIEEDGETAVFVVVAGTAVTPGKTAAVSTLPEGKADGEPIPVPKWVAQRRLIKVGYGDSDHVEVLEGIVEGDRIVTVGRSAVRDGTAIQVLEAAQ